MDISPIESEVRMDRLKNLENEYERWEHIYKYGSSDPFYARPPRQSTPTHFTLMA